MPKITMGWTALMVAARYGHLEVVKVLLAKGADVNAKDNAGNTALMVAAKYGHPEVVKILKDAEVKSGIVDVSPVRSVR